MEALATLYRWHGEALSLGEAPLPRQIVVQRTELPRDLMAEWKERLLQPSAGHATVAAERRNGWMASSRSSLCRSSPDTVVSGGTCFVFSGMICPGVNNVWTVQRTWCSIWWRYALLGQSTTVSSWRRSLAPGTGRNHGGGGRRGMGSRHFLLQSSNASEREKLHCSISRFRRCPIGRPYGRLRRRRVVKISGAMKMLTEGKQRVALHPNRTEPESAMHCVPRELQGAGSTIEGTRYQDNYLPGPREPFKRETAYLETVATERTGEFLVSRSLTLPSAPPLAGGCISTMIFRAPPPKKGSTYS